MTVSESHSLHLLHAVSNAIFRRVVQQLAICHSASRGPSTIAEPLLSQQDSLLKPDNLLVNISVLTQFHHATKTSVHCKNENFSEWQLHVCKQCAWQLRHMDHILIGSHDNTNSTNITSPCLSIQYHEFGKLHTSPRYLRLHRSLGTEIWDPFQSRQSCLAQLKSSWLKTISRQFCTARCFISVCLQTHWLHYLCTCWLHLSHTYVAWI